MPWIKDVAAVVQGWYSGSEAGNAIADVLSGDVNPSGKLPFTFPVRLEDVGAHAMGEYPGNADAFKCNKDTMPEYYKDDIFVGYRHADKIKNAPLFPFGHGLSYTSFEYGKPMADKKQMDADGTITFSINVKNTGKIAGKETVQLYISDKKSSLPRPVKELKGFSKVELAPGEEKTVTFIVGKEELSYFDDAKHAWVAEPGTFEALFGSSSRDIRGSLTFKLTD